MAEATSKERTKISATAEKKVAAPEKARALTKKRFANLEAKMGETGLKLAEADSLNSVRVEELANLRAALEGCESKWYNEGCADVENSLMLGSWHSKRGGLQPFRPWVFPRTPL